MSHRLYQMSFASVFQALIKKIERKGHDSKRVYAITSWLTGYSIETIKNLEQTDLTYGQFLLKALKILLCKKSVAWISWLIG